MSDEPTVENEKMKLCFIDFTTEETDGVNVKRTSSNIRGETLDDCLKYTRLLHTHESDPSIEIGEVAHPIKVERTIEEVLQHCAKLRGVHGLSWRTLHEFFWFVSASKWGNRECYTDKEHEVYRNFNGRPVGLNVSFDKMLLDMALLFEEYCENEYGAVRNTIEEYDAMFDVIEMIDPDIRKQVRAYHTATELIKSIDRVLEKLGDDEDATKD